MSLSTLNYPPLVALSGVGLGASLPVIEKLAMSSPWQAVRAASLLSYAINFLAVRVPGRMDGQASDDPAVESSAAQLSPRRGKTLVAPSGWAFVIWAPIFLGEMISVLAPFLLDKNDPIIDLLRKTSGPFIVANLFQTLWCAAFRPKYKGLSRYISTGMLGATAFSLSKAHAAFAANSQMYTNAQYFVFFLPLTLHFGWVTAASLVNLNGSVSMQENASSTVIKRVGHASVILATAIGVIVATKRDAPVYAGVITWALTAVADGMKKRIDTAEEKPEEKSSRIPLIGKKQTDAVAEENIGLDGASTQYMLARAGALINALAAAFVTGSMSTSSKSIPIP